MNSKDPDQTLQLAATEFGLKCLHNTPKRVKKVKVSDSLIAVGAVGVRVPLYLGHS